MSSGQEEVASHYRRPRVTIIGTRGYPSHYGGLETAIRHLVPFLAQQGWEVIVWNRHDTHVDYDNLPDHVTVRVAPSIEKKSLSNLTSGLTSTLGTIIHGTDVALVMNTANGFWIPLLRMLKIPTLINTDGLEWERDKWGKLAKSVLFAGAWCTAKFGDVLVFDAKAIRNYWTKRFKRTGLYIPYGGTDVSNDSRPQGIPNGDYVLLVARFVPENTVKEFLDAAPEIAQHYPVVLVGSSGWNNELDRRAQELDESFPDIVWLGHVDDENIVNSLFSHAGLYFHGHSVGGTNPALVQAMASGAPVLARDTVYAREVLGNDGEFVAPQAQKIVRTVLKLMNDPDKRKEMSIRNQNRAREMFTWESVCSEYHDALRRLLNRKFK